MENEGSGGYIKYRRCLNYKETKKIPAEDFLERSSTGKNKKKDFCKVRAFSPLWLQTEESIFHAARMLLQSFDWIYSRLYFVNYFLFRAYQRGDFPLVLSHTGRGCKLVWKVSIFFLLFIVNSEQRLQDTNFFIIIVDL